MTKSTSNIRFRAKLLRPAEPAKEGSWTFLILPKDASAKLPTRGTTTVAGIINGHPFRATLEPDGQKSHWLKVNKKMREAAGAEAGDVVSIDVEGVTVNGRLLGNSAPQATDPAGRPLPVYRLYNYQLQDGEVLTMSDYSGRSFDSRYYGPIPCACIQSVVRPIFTW